MCYLINVCCMMVCTLAASHAHAAHVTAAASDHRELLAYVGVILSAVCALASFLAVWIRRMLGSSYEIRVLTVYTSDVSHA